jgi:hypothetical protein
MPKYFLTLYCRLVLKFPISVATLSKAWTVFVRSNTGVVCSNPTRGMDVYLHLFCVYVVLCSRLATGWSPVQGVLPTMHKIKKSNWIETMLRAPEGATGNMNEWMNEWTFWNWQRRIVHSSASASLGMFRLMAETSVFMWGSCHKFMANNILWLRLLGQGFRCVLSVLPMWAIWNLMRTVLSRKQNIQISS